MRQDNDGRWISADGRLVWDGTCWVPRPRTGRRTCLLIVIIASALVVILLAGVVGAGVYLVNKTRAPAASGSGPCRPNEPISLTVVIDGSATQVCTAKAPTCIETGNRPAAVLHVTSGLRNGTPGDWTLRMAFNPSPDPSWSNRTYDVRSGGLSLFIDAGLPFPESGGWQSTEGSAILSVTSREIAGTVDLQASGTGSTYTDAHITGPWACSIAA